MTETHTPQWEIGESKEPETYLQLRDRAARMDAVVCKNGRVFLKKGSLPYFRPAALPDLELTGCDIDDLIARLQALRAAAVEHFGPGWPG
jgi:hypothetical protein